MFTLPQRMRIFVILFPFPFHTHTQRIMIKEWVVEFRLAEYTTLSRKTVSVPLFCSHTTITTKDFCDFRRCGDSTSSKKVVLHQWKPTGCPPVQFSSDPVYLEVLSDAMCGELSPQDASLPLHACQSQAPGGFTHASDPLDVNQASHNPLLGFI